MTTLVSVNAEELTIVVTISILMRPIVNANAKAPFLAPVADITTQRHANVIVLISVTQTLHISITPVNVYLTQPQDVNHF